MTQSPKAEKPALHCAGELLWTVSLLPIFHPPQPHAASALVIDLPFALDHSAPHQRNAA